jgi:hypothetical protein
MSDSIVHHQAMSTAEIAPSWLPAQVNLSFENANTIYHRVTFMNLVDLHNSWIWY